MLLLVGALCLLFGFDALVVCLVDVCCSGYCDFGAFVFLLFCSNLFVGWGGWWVGCCYLHFCCYLVCCLW